LADAFRTYWLAIETNGTYPLKAKLDWITLSPKTTIHNSWESMHINELKLPIQTGQILNQCYDTYDISYHLLSPIFDGSKLVKENLEWAIKLCLENPKWRLTVQNHKLWEVK
jgi:organic radical activating enzyme